jgi:hypothetical protein
MDARDDYRPPALTPDLIPARDSLASLTMSIVRELELDDLKLLLDAPPVGIRPMERVKIIHRRQAELLASGRKLSEVAAIVGSTPQRLTQLLRDPSFQELVSYYEDQFMTTAMNDAERIRTKVTDIAELAADEMLERLDDPERRRRMSDGNLRQVMEVALDRTVLPPKSTTPVSTPPTKITLNLGRELRPVDSITIEHQPKEPSDE